LLLGVSPSLEDLADEFPEDYEQVACSAAIVSRLFFLTINQLSMISRMTDADQDNALGSLLEDPELQRHFTTASKLQKLKESIDVAAEIDPKFIAIRDSFKQKHPSM
jgi:hypothetical protein